MGHRSVTIEIAAPPERVFDLYADFRRLSEWQGQSGFKGTEGAFDRPGADFVIRFAGPFTLRGTVLALQRPSLHRIRARELAGLVTCETTARFDPADGGTRLTFEYDYQVAGGVVGRLFDGVAGRDMQTRGARDAAGLKGLAERTNERTS
jgi:uncharacterized protein YndB with AHSA1/START domain